MTSPAPCGPPDYGFIFPSYFTDKDANEKTFQYDETLPSLPIPTLAHTLTKYLESVLPYLTPDEFAKTRSIVERFGSGIGQVLHQKLHEKNKYVRNWLEQWWFDYAYLMTRTPTAIFSNFAGDVPFPNKLWPPMEGTQLERAALICFVAMRYWFLFRREQRRVDRSRTKKVWSMVQYRSMFNTCKIPRLVKDEIRTSFKTESEGPCPSHIVVICMGRIFTMDTLDPAGELITAPEFETHLRHIDSSCRQQGTGPGLGSLTADNRDTWATLRQHIIELHPDNRRHLDAIETSAFSLVLGSRSPESRTEVTREGLIGDCDSRWFDKSITCIVSKNGKISMNCDHAPADGIVMISATLWNIPSLASTNGTWQGPTTVRDLPKPQELTFHLDDRVRRGIEDARRTFQRNGDNVELYVGTFRQFGKSFMRRFKLQPDTFVQMALQYAYYRMHGRPAPIYETATTRQFYHGRTETVRGCTVSVIGWIKAMMEPTTTNSHRLKLMMAAMNNHNTLMAEAVNNMGCDRHLLGLQILAMEEGIPLPDIYTDPAYTKSGGNGNFILSTSFLGYSPVLGGLPPMCTDGYGAFYNILPDRISAFLSTWRDDRDTEAVRFFENLETSLCDMKKLLLATATANL